jgi:putative ABC transport system permease protein
VNFLLVWRNAMYSKSRTFLALSAICFAVVLIFMQLALFDTLEISSVILTNMLDFDAVLISSQYNSIQSPGSFSRTRMYQALGVSGVKSVSPIYMRLLPWRNIENRSQHVVMVLGADPIDPVFLHPEILRQLPLLHETDRVLMDRRMLPNYGPAYPGLVSEAGGHSLEVAGLFSNGGGFYAGGLLICSDRTFNRLGVSLESPTMGLIKLQPEEDLASVVAAMRSVLPPDVRVLTRKELGAEERHYWIHVKPIGVMFSSGVFIGMIVGAVILYQVLANDVAQRIREYATMKAMGYTDLAVNLTVLKQSMLFMVVSFVVGLILSIGMYDVMARGAGFPLAMTWRRAVHVLVITLLMSLVSGVLAVRKVSAADPADLF